MKKRFTAVLFTLLFCMIYTGGAQAYLLLDDKLDVRGSLQQTTNIYTHEDQRDIRLSSFRTMGRLEAGYTAYHTQELRLKFYGLVNYYYDNALQMDSDLRSAIREEAGSSKFRYYERPRNSDEWLKELYVDLMDSGAFQIRLGKQLVSWGDVADARVADVVNPIDNKYRLAFPDWEDYKLGLWMARMFYTPEDWWQNLSFEAIIIPFDFEENRGPPAPGLIGLPIFPNRMAQQMLDAQRSDAPHDGLRNCEGGLRIRGYAEIGEGVDWVVSHFYSRLDSPLVDGTQGAINILTMGGILPSFLRKGDTYKYPFYNSTAFILNTTWDKIGAAIRSEWVYNTNRDYQYGTSTISGDSKEKDLIVGTIKVAFSGIMVPYYSDRMFGNKNRAMSLSITLSQYWMKNHEYNRSTGEYIMGETGTQPRMTKIAWAAMWFFNNDKWIVNYFGSYDSSDKGVHITGLTYMPYDRWKFSASYMKNSEGSSISRYMDQVIFEVRHEFY